MKAIISIPVHEKPDVIRDQINNIKKYFPEAEIVIHVSKEYFKQWKLEEIGYFPGVYINPQHLETHWGDILLPHISNFNYIHSLNLDYDYFVMHSSNDMYVRYGVADYIKSYQAGFTFRYMKRPSSHWWPCEYAFKDPLLKALMDKIRQSRIVASQLEGSFYKREIIEKIMDFIQESIMDTKINQFKPYTREEFFFSTVAETLVSPKDVGYPIVFSEVHRFDRIVWPTFKKIDDIYAIFFHYFLSPRWLERIKRFYSTIISQYGNFRITPEIIQKIRHLDNNFFLENLYLDDGTGAIRLYDKPSSLFAVKRVPRDINHPLRLYIHNLP